ncbi:MAG TPA: GNAT family N-acetyltransferase [Gemmatimonadaceae bacterium]|nr:GNAT family N-acetyltransferase [Gemmatimonadaceae bacterium]
MTGAVELRTAVPADVEGIAALVNDFAAARIMLPVRPEQIALALHNFVVGVDERERVVACGALKEYSPSLAEVASVAVAVDVHGRGLGRRIVRRLEELAAVRGTEELFALTLTPAFFEALGYGAVERACYPEKITRDCRACARRSACAEVCVRRMLHARELEVAA